MIIGNLFIIEYTTNLKIVVGVVFGLGVVTIILNLIGGKGVESG